MPDRIHVGTATDTECRVTVIGPDSGHVRLDTCGSVIFLTVSDANRLCNHLITAMNHAVDQGLIAALYRTADLMDEAEPGGATSAWEHRYGV